MQKRSYFKLIAYIIPLLFITWIGIVLLAPSKTNPNVSATVLGLLGKNSQQISLRLVADYQEGSKSAAAASFPFEVMGRSDKVIFHWSGETDSEGIAEILEPLKEPLPDLFQISVYQNRKMVADGIVHSPRKEFSTRSDEIFGTSQGSINIKAYLSKSYLAADFEEKIEFHFMDQENRKLKDVHIEFNILGASKEKMIGKSDRDGKYVLILTPISHGVDLQLTASMGDIKTTWNALVNVRPGAFGFDASLSRIISSSPRTVAYYSVYSNHGRIHGGKILFEKDDKNYFSAILHLPQDVQMEDFTTLVVSSDVFEQASSTTDFPIQKNNHFYNDSRLERLVFSNFEKNTAKRSLLGTKPVQIGIIVLGSFLEILFIMVLIQTKAESPSEQIPKQKLPFENTYFGILILVLLCMFILSIIFFLK